MIPKNIKDTVKLSDVIEELVEERGLDRNVLGSIISEGMLAAYQKKYPTLSLRAHYDKKTDEVVVEVEKTVVSAVENESTEISLRRAQNIDKDFSAGQQIWLPFDGSIGRIEILRAKQVIASKIRKIEADAVFNEFKDKEGTIVHGIIHKCERGGATVKLQDFMAFLPKSLMSPADKCVVGYSIRALLKEVLPEPRNENQLILDRASEQFLFRLFELEIPEVFERLVEVKEIVRAPGYKSKVVVVSNDPNIDPVGTCVGVGGARIKPILKELGGEKIDVLSWSDSPEIMVKNALKPAIINNIEIKNNRALVMLDDDQRSLAIGKGGQNIALAARLVHMDINLVQGSSEKATRDAELLFDEQQEEILE